MFADLQFSRHATRRMVGRHISPAEVEEAWTSRDATYAVLGPRAGRCLVILGTTARGRRLKVVVLARDERLMVDLEADGRLHGIELLCPPGDLGDAERAELAARFPAADQALTELQRIMPLPA